MGNWRFIQIVGRLPSGVDTREISSFLNEHEDIEYFQDIFRGIHGLDYWISHSHDLEINIMCTIGKCPGDLDFITKEMQILSARYPKLELVIDVGCGYECQVCEASFYVSKGMVEIKGPRINKIGHQRGHTCDACAI